MPQLWRFHLLCQEYLLELARHRSADEAWALVESWLHDPTHIEPGAGTAMPGTLSAFPGDCQYG
jgi:hypothetical protein